MDKNGKFLTTNPPLLINVVIKCPLKVKERVSKCWGKFQTTALVKRERGCWKSWKISMTSFMDDPNQSISPSLFFDHVVYEQPLIPRASRAGGCILTFFLSDFLEGNKSIPPLLGTDQSLTRKKPLQAKKRHLI